MEAGSIEYDLMRRVRADPDDDDARLILADWWDECGDPRGRFVRVQLALARIGEFDPRKPLLEREERRLLARHERAWSRPFDGLATGLSFRGGLIDGVKMTARQFVRHAERIFEIAPIRKLDLLDAGSHAAAVFDSPLLAKLRGLSLFAQHLGPGELWDRIVACPDLTHLQSLELGRNNLTDAAVVSLTRAPFFPSLVELSLRDNPLGDDGTTAVGERGAMLESLDLSHTSVTIRGATAGPPSLRSLNLTGNSAIGRVAHAQPQLLDIHEVNLSSCGITATSLERLLDDRERPIRSLSLNDNRLGSEGARRLAESRAIANLRSLDLRRNEIADPGAIALASSIHLRRCVRFDISFNPIGSSGWSAFLDPHALPHCRRFGWTPAEAAQSLIMQIHEKYR